MLASGIPETADEAHAIIRDVAARHADAPEPAHYPHSQIVALSQTVDRLLRRVQQLEAKPRRGRPPKNPTADLISKVAEHL